MNRATVHATMPNVYVTINGRACIIHSASACLDSARELISDLGGTVLRDKLTKLHEAAHVIGVQLEEPFLQLAFLALPVIPMLKITDRGLVHLDQLHF